jgi:hypothetical protein
MTIALRLLALSALVLAMAGLADADPLCVTGNVSSIANTSCTIGNLLFSFGGFTNTANSTIIFSPDTSNPLGPGFTLSGDISVPANPQGLPDSASFGIGVQISSLNGQSTIAGFNTTVNGFMGPPGALGSGSLFAAFGTNQYGVADAQAYAGFNEDCFGPSCSATAYYYSPQSVTPDIPAAYGINDNGRAGTATSASFYVLEVPEIDPSRAMTPFVLIVGAMIIIRGRRKKSGERAA